MFILALELAKLVAKKSGPKLVDFTRILESKDKSDEISKNILELKERVEKFAQSFPMPGLLEDY